MKKKDKDHNQILITSFLKKNTNSTAPSPRPSILAPIQVTPMPQARPTSADSENRAAPRRKTSKDSENHTPRRKKPKKQSTPTSMLQSLAKALKWTKAEVFRNFSQTKNKNDLPPSLLTLLERYLNEGGTANNLLSTFYYNENPSILNFITTFLDVHFQEIYLDNPMGAHHERSNSTSSGISYQDLVQSEAGPDAEPPEEETAMHLSFLLSEIIEVTSNTEEVIELLPVEVENASSLSQGTTNAVLADTGLTNNGTTSPQEDEQPLSQGTINAFLADTGFINNGTTSPQEDEQPLSQGTINAFLADTGFTNNGTTPPQEDEQPLSQGTINAFLADTEFTNNGTTPPQEEAITEQTCIGCPIGYHYTICPSTGYHASSH